jgi:hypothetical protein
MTKVRVEKDGRRFYNLSDELLQCSTEETNAGNACVCPGDLYTKNGNSFAEDDLRMLALNSCNVNAKLWATAKIAEAINTDSKTSTHHTDKIFDILGSQKNYPVQDANLIRLIQSVFPQGSKDRWLADTILKFGPEPLWPKKAFIEFKTKRFDKPSTVNRNGVRAVIGYTANNREVEAYYFEGRSDECALVIAGVHGTERSGVEIAEQLIKTLSNSSRRPYFSLIIIPTLFPDNYHWQMAKSRRKVLNGIRETCMNGKGRKCKRGFAIPTNRNFPPQGVSLATAEKIAKPAKKRKDRWAEAEGHGPGRDEKERSILRENKMLMGLINRFQPTRILSIHSTWNPKRAGIFSEPVKVRYNKNTRKLVRSRAKSETEAAKSGVGKKTLRKAIRIAGKVAVKWLRGESKAAAAKDRKLALRMARRMKDMGMKKSVLGNKRKNAKWRGKMGRGTSLGMWGSSRIREGGPEDREPIVVITLEAPKYHRSADCGVTEKKCKPEKRLMEIEAFKDAIKMIFLENPEGDFVSLRSIETFYPSQFA